MLAENQLRFIGGEILAGMQLIVSFCSQYGDIQGDLFDNILEISRYYTLPLDYIS